jgi:Holliday junction resolvasome RuvABC endonuclease subunit
MILRAVGVDPSWECSGVGLVTADRMHMTRLPYGISEKGRTTAEQDLAHIQRMASKVFATIRDYLEGRTGLVVFEGPSMGSTFGRPDERAGIRWIVTNAVSTQLGAVVAFVPPSTCKKYWTGDGRAQKDKMLGYTASRYPGLTVPDHNANDGFALAHMGATYLDLISESSPPAVIRSSLAGVRWPARLQEAHT